LEGSQGPRRWRAQDRERRREQGRGGDHQEEVRGSGRQGRNQVMERRPLAGRLTMVRVSARRRWCVAVPGELVRKLRPVFSTISRVLSGPSLTVCRAASGKLPRATAKCLFSGFLHPARKGTR